MTNRSSSTFSPLSYFSRQEDNKEDISLIHVIQISTHCCNEVAIDEE